MNVLFVSSEAYPLIKTGGLADVSASLPRALLQMKQEVRLLLPAYQSLLEQVKNPRLIAQTYHYGQEIRVLETTLPGTRVKTWLVDCPLAFDRPGNPYVDQTGAPWPDNAFRFALFAQVAVDIALNRIGLNWPVDIVHCNDWQAGLVPALLSLHDQRPASVFTIHNLAYQGLFDKQVFFDLGLPGEFWTMHGVEFHDMFSFIKGGLSYADAISTVSPKYAKEIQTATYGYGLEHLLKFRADRLVGILNGIDTQVWNPGTDSYLVQRYNARTLTDKVNNKSALQQQLGLEVDTEIPMLGLISRLVEQKGLDMILQAIPTLIKVPLQLVFLGSGEPKYEQGLTELAQQYPKSIAAIIGYNEQLSHRIEAASDMYLMPSLFEPCGLNQLYSLRYGTIPIVTPVGGLYDSVVDHAAATPQAPANGFVMEDDSAEALIKTIRRAVTVYQHKSDWLALQRNGMKEDHAWTQSAREYIDLYESASTWLITKNQQI